MARALYIILDFSYFFIISGFLDILAIFASLRFWIIILGLCANKFLSLEIVFRGFPELFLIQTHFIFESIEVSEKNYHLHCKSR